MKNINNIKNIRNLYKYILLKLSFFLILLSFINISNIASASSYVYAKTGEELVLNIKNKNSSSDISWIISQEGNILDTVKSKNFKYTFKKDGIYTIKVNETRNNGDINSSLIEVNVSAKLPSFAPLEAKLTAIPEIKDGVITLSGEKEEVVFSFSESTGNIKNYALESDIFVDSNGDEIPDNDIDNKNDASFLSGAYFKRTYLNTGIPSRAILTLTDDNGNKKQTSVTILFDEESNDLVIKPLNVKVTTLPKINKSNVINLSRNKNSVFVFLGKSTGKIKQYKIDENLAVDSDGDGDPKNDFDNKDTESATNGISYPVTVDKNLSTQEFSVTVVGEYEEKTKIYTVKNNSSYKNENTSFLKPLLFSSRTRILEGESVTFNIFNYPENSKVSWDFNGDGIFEIENQDVSKVEYLYANEGIYNALFSLTEAGNEPIVQRKTITVLNESEGQLKTEPPFSYFYPQTDGNKASFISSQSKADENLANTDLSYSWDFGDGFKAQGPNVEHIYEKEGNYTVTLTVEDSVSRTGVYSDIVIISSITQDFEATQHGGSVIREDENNDSKKTENSDNIVKSDDDSVKDVTNEVNNNNPINDKNLEKEEGWEKINPVNNQQTDISKDMNSDSSSGFSWWILFICILLLLPFLFLLKKKLEDPEKSFSDILKDLNPKKSLEDLKEKSENSENSNNSNNSNVEEEIEEVLEENIIVEDDSIVDPVEPVNLVESEETGDLPDWMQESSGLSEEIPEEELEENIIVEDNNIVDSVELVEPVESEEFEETVDLPDWMQESSGLSKEPESLENSNNSNVPEEISEEELEKNIIVEDDNIVESAGSEETGDLPDLSDILEKPLIKAIDAKIKTVVKEKNGNIPEWLKT